MHSFPKILLFFGIICVFIVNSEEIKNIPTSLDDFNDVLDTTGSIPWHEMEFLKEMRLGKLHTDVILGAIHENEGAQIQGTIVEVREVLDKDYGESQSANSGLNLGQFNGEEDFGFYDTKTSYTFHKDFDYFSLDHPDIHENSIRLLSAHEIHQCSSEFSHLQGLRRSLQSHENLSKEQQGKKHQQKIVAGKSILLGSSAGSWSRSSSVQSYIESGDVHSHEYVSDDEIPLFLYRRVLKVEEVEYSDVSSDSDLSSNRLICTKITTETIKPMEMFGEWTTESLVDHPYRINYYDIMSEMDAQSAMNGNGGNYNRQALENLTEDQAVENRRKLQPGLTANDGIVPCSSTSVWGYQSDWYFAGGGGSSSYEYKIST